jgi:hypothetical protein
MIYDTKRFQEIMQKLDLTPNQIYFCILLLEQDYNRKVQMFNNYIDRHGGFRFLEIDDLETKGFIENFSNTEIPKTVKITTTKKGEVKYERVTDVMILELIVVTPLFKDQIYVDAELATDELLQAYPTWIIIKDKSGKTQRVSVKSVPDRDEFIQFYSNIINGDILKHKLIVEMATHLRRFVEKKEVMATNIRKALESRFWEQIEELIELEKDDKDMITRL